jgi:hypothetical protein
MGNREIEDSLERLDKLTKEETRMASAEQLKTTHNIDRKVMGVDDRVMGVEGQVAGVRGEVQDVRVDVQDVRVDVRDVGSNIRGVDDKLEQSNRSLSFQTPDRHSVSSDSFTGNQLKGSLLRWLPPPPPQIHPPIITSHAKPITTAQLNGFSKEVYSIGGNLLAPSCGYTENVCYS